MQTAGDKDHEEKLHRRLLATGIEDGRFIKRFFERWGNDIRSDLTAAETYGSGRYEEELGVWIEAAEKDYQHYELDRPAEVQEGEISPKKRKSRRVRKSKDVAGIWDRQETLAQYLAGVASADRRIVAFRKRVLSKRFLSEEQAMAFLSSPLAASEGMPASFELLRLDPLGVILDTDYEVKDEQDGSGPYKKLVWGRRRLFTIRPLLRTRRHIFPGEHVTQDDLRILGSPHAIVVFPHPRERDSFVVAARNSFIEQLTNLVDKCMNGYPISLEMGVWFILTGKFEAQDPVRIRYMTTRWPDVLSRTTITLEVESWLPPEEVLKQYTHAQQEILGKTPRSLKRKTLDVFTLVNNHKGKSWSKLLGTWNREHPGERFKYRSRLYDTYARAFELLTGVELITAERWEADTSLRVLDTDSHGSPIFADKWYLLHENGFTGTFDSREEAQADSRSEGSEVLASAELVARLAERAKKTRERQN